MLQMHMYLCAFRVIENGMCGWISLVFALGQGLGGLGWIHYLHLSHMYQFMYQ